MVSGRCRKAASGPARSPVVFSIPPCNFFRFAILVLMADLRKRLASNAPGDFFVDSTCIDCDTCRQLAPNVFGEADGYSFVQMQPQTSADRHRALQATIACPTGSIGAPGAAAREVVQDFPMLLAPDVSYCGFNSPKSFGGNSYFVERPDGNWLIDSPRYIEHLARRFENAGGIRFIFLTHRDDVADAAKYAQRFGAQRIIHRLELSAQPDAEIVLSGFAETRISPEFLAIPTPGHTRGHCALLYQPAAEGDSQPAKGFALDIPSGYGSRKSEARSRKWQWRGSSGEREQSSRFDAQNEPNSAAAVFETFAGSSGAGAFLFSGDHLWWSPARRRLHASRDVCWYSWEQQKASIERLRDYSFEWVLPGHGHRARLEPGEAQRQIAKLLAEMRQVQ
jgi:glyoxylase-like metal-dependent hydrolase (beta-lactamase superfamily II)/ferredoxin